MNNNCNANMNCSGKPACSCGGTCQNQDMTRQQLLDVINQAGFAVDDMLLYLDTHPDDMEALAYYQKQSCIRRDALQNMPGSTDRSRLIWWMIPAVIPGNGCLSHGRGNFLRKAGVKVYVDL